MKVVMVEAHGQFRNSYGGNMCCWKLFLEDWYRSLLRPLADVLTVVTSSMFKISINSVINPNLIYSHIKMLSL